VENRDHTGYRWTQSDRWIARETHHGRDLIREIRRGLNSLNDPLIRKHIFRAARKVTSELMAKADRLTRRDPRLGCKYLAHILDESTKFPSVSECTVYKILPSNVSRARWRIRSQWLTYSRGGWVGQTGDERHEVVGGLYAAENPKALRQQ
jgi:hypothetical protein